MQCVTNKLVVCGFAVMVLLVVVASCARDHALQPFRTQISFDRSRSHPFISDVPPSNAPSTRDWKTNQDVGAGYGTTSSTAAPQNVASPSGAASTPSGTSSGTATGVTSGGAGVSTAPALGPSQALLELLLAILQPGPSVLRRLFQP